MKKLRRKNGFLYYVSGGAAWSLAPPPPAPRQKSVIALTDVFDITCDIGNRKTHISCPH